MRVSIAYGASSWTAAAEKQITYNDQKNQSGSPEVLN
jgi:hypothetical protein